MEMLPASLHGRVVKFSGQGRTLGYPTANIGIDTDLTDGVYFGFADLGGYSHHPAIIFIGTPTTMGETVRRVEAHLLDIPDQDCYGEELTLYIHRYHRANETFGSIEELIAAMKHDEKVAREWFSRAEG